MIEMWVFLGVVRRRIAEPGESSKGGSSLLAGLCCLPACVSGRSVDQSRTSSLCALALDLAIVCSPNLCLVDLVHQSIISWFTVTVTLASQQDALLRPLRLSHFCRGPFHRDPTCYLLRISGPTFRLSPHSVRKPMFLHLAVSRSS